MRRGESVGDCRTKAQGNQAQDLSNPSERERDEFQSRSILRTGRVRRVKRERMKSTRLAKSPHSADFGLSEDFEILSISGKQTLETIA